MLDLKIAKPCDQSWTAMKGDEKVRHCQACRKNVYNIAEMTEKEVEELIVRTEGKFCARIYRRTDNRVITKDCPRGVAAVRRRIALSLATACAAVIYGVSAFGRPKTFSEAKKTAVELKPVKWVTPKEDVVMGKRAMPTMGSLAAPIRMGELAVIPKRVK